MTQMQFSPFSAIRAGKPVAARLDGFGSIRTGYGLTSHTVAEPFPLPVGCLAVEVGTPHLSVNAIFIPSTSLLRKKSCPL